MNKKRGNILAVLRRLIYLYDQCSQYVILGIQNVKRSEDQQNSRYLCRSILIIQNVRMTYITLWNVSKYYCTKQFLMEERWGMQLGLFDIRICAKEHMIRRRSRYETFCIKLYIFCFFLIFYTPTTCFGLQWSPSGRWLAKERVNLILYFLRASIKQDGIELL